MLHEERGGRLMVLLVLAALEVQCASAPARSTGGLVAGDAVRRPNIEQTCRVESAYAGTEPSELIAVDWWLPVVWVVEKPVGAQGIVRRFSGLEGPPDVWEFGANVQQRNGRVCVRAENAHSKLAEFELEGELTTQDHEGRAILVTQYVVNDKPDSPFPSTHVTLFEGFRWAERMRALSLCAESALRAAQ